MWRGRGTTVNLLKVAGTNVALVSDHPESIAAFRRSLERTVAERAPVTMPRAVW